MSTPARVSTYAFVNPVVAVFLGWAFAGEQLSARELAAAAIIILAVVLITFTQAAAPARSTPALPVHDAVEGPVAEGA